MVLNLRASIWIASAVVVVLGVVGAMVDLGGSDRWRSSCTGSLPRLAGDDDVARSIRDELPSFAEGTSVAVEVVDLDSCAEVTSLDAGSGFPTASVVKLLIAIDAVERSADAAGDIERMLSTSDDEVASRLWTANGGPDIVRRTAAKLGLADTVPPQSSGRWGSTRMSASDVARVYQYLAAEADAGTRKLLLGALGQALLAPRPTDFRSTSAFPKACPSANGRSSRGGDRPTPAPCCTPPDWSTGTGT